MKRLFEKGCALLLAAVLLVGCVAPREPLTEAQKIDRLARVLSITTSSAVTIAAEDRKQSTRDAIVEARRIISGLATSGEISIEEFIARLTPLYNDAKPEVRVALNSALSLLQVYYSDYVVNLPAGNANAVKFLNAVVAGIDQGLKLAPPVNP